MAAHSKVQVDSCKDDAASMSGGVSYLSTIGNSRGQIAVEYMLLIVVGVAIYMALVTGLVSRNPESPGMVMKKWVELIKFIGQDRIENDSAGEE